MRLRLTKIGKVLVGKAIAFPHARRQSRVGGVGL